VRWGTKSPKMHMCTASMFHRILSEFSKNVPIIFKKAIRIAQSWRIFYESWQNIIRTQYENPAISNQHTFTSTAFLPLLLHLLQLSLLRKFSCSSFSVAYTLCSFCPPAPHDCHCPSCCTPPKQNYTKTFKNLHKLKNIFGQVPGIPISL